LFIIKKKMPQFLFHTERGINGDSVTETRISLFSLFMRMRGVSLKNLQQLNSTVNGDTLIEREMW